ncbi:MAG: alpha/beta hydrolase [Gemmatimonadota bacterium]
MEDDLPLHVELRGHGPPIVLLHGFGATSYTWRHWLPALAERHTAVLVDLKGFGRAPKPDDGRYGPGEQAELVVRMMVRQDLSRATVVGHSLGGAVALLVALRLRDQGEERRIARLVSVAGAAYPQPIPRFVSLARRRWLARAVLRAVPKRWLIRTVLEDVVHDPASMTEDQVRAYAEPLATRGGRRAMLQAARQIVPENVEAWTRRFPELDLPTLLLWGNDDRVVPPWVGRRLAADLPCSRLIVLPDCGHIPQEERPTESLEALLGFLGGTREGPEGA